MLMMSLQRVDNSNLQYLDTVLIHLAGSKHKVGVLLSLHMVCGAVVACTLRTVAVEGKVFGPLPFDLITPLNDRSSSSLESRSLRGGSVRSYVQAHPRLIEVQAERAVPRNVK